MGPLSSSLSIVSEDQPTCWKFAEQIHLPGLCPLWVVEEEKRKHISPLGYVCLNRNGGGSVTGQFTPHAGSGKYQEGGVGNVPHQETGRETPPQHGSSILSLSSPCPFYPLKRKRGIVSGG